VELYHRFKYVLKCYRYIYAMVCNHDTQKVYTFFTYKVKSSRRSKKYDKFIHIPVKIS